MAYLYLNRLVLIWAGRIFLKKFKNFPLVMAITTLRAKGLAEREGFEPPIPFQVWPLSRRLVSTAHAPLRADCIQSSALSTSAMLAESFCSDSILAAVEYRAIHFPRVAASPLGRACRRLAA